MTSSKVILVGAISVVFGLYSISLMRVDGAVGRTAETAIYLAKASDNARSGVQRALNYISRVRAVSGTVNQTYQLDAGSTEQGSFNFTATCTLVGSTWQLTIVSHGVYKSPLEPAAFQGHEVIRTAYAEFPNTDYDPSAGYFYDVRMKAAFSSVNYTREQQLDSLQTGKSNLIGY